MKIQHTRRWWYILTISIITTVSMFGLTQYPKGEEEIQKNFGVDKNGRPLEYIENAFEDRGDVIADHATGLMWQQSGSDERMTYAEAQAYIEELNRKQFAGYDDWRLPTVKELVTLLERERESLDLFINPIFGRKQWFCWSADKHSSGLAWHVDFFFGRVTWDVINNYHVRGVRSAPTPMPTAKPTIPILRLEAQGEVVRDLRTGLMWQQSGSDKRLTHEEAQVYVEQLNRDRFASYSDWRLPTVEDFKTLISNRLYTNPIFNAEQSFVWSADKWAEGSALEAPWLFSFENGLMIGSIIGDTSYVRCVRP